MTTRIYTDRSRVETYDRCKRRRWLEYHEAGTGIQPSRKNIHLAVGGAVHSGQAVLLIRGQKLVDDARGNVDLAFTQRGWLADMENAAVAAALADFSQFSGKLEGDDLPAVVAVPNQGFVGTGLTNVPSGGAQQSRVVDFNAQLQQEAIALGLDPTNFTGPSLDERRSKAEAYLFAELSALVEALVRAYARRRLRPLLEEFEVLEVEREGEWKLGVVVCRDCGGMGMDLGTPGGDGSIESYDDCPTCQGKGEFELWFLSRPDALLRHRQTNELQLLSFKTTGGWDLRKARDVQHDMQGLSEGVEVERRFCDWWNRVHEIAPFAWKSDPYLQGCTQQIFDFLRGLSAAPRVSAIRYEFLLKGERWRDRDLSAQLGVEARIQKSHLIYQYVATSTPKTGKNTESFRVGDVCWSWEFTRIEDQQSSKLYAGNWRPRAVWEGGTNSVRDWIDRLDRSELCMSGEDSTVGLEPRPLGFKSDAQAMGVTAEHPLDSVFVPPVTVYRQEDQLLDWVEQVAEQEQKVAGHVAEIAAAKDAGEKRSLLNRHFAQTRTACEYPTQCPFARERVGVCWAGAEMQADPLAVGGGEYVRRVPNHPKEGAVE